jgi:hypothetical protein
MADSALDKVLTGNIDDVVKRLDEISKRTPETAQKHVTIDWREDGKFVIFKCDHIRYEKFPVRFTLTIGADKKVEMCRYCYNQFMRDHIEHLMIEAKRPC